MPEPSHQPGRLVRRELEQGQQEHQGQQAAAAVRSETTFETPEEALRLDRENLGVPPEVGKRLESSIRREPRPARAWWRRLLGS